MDGRPNRRNKAAFSNFYGVVWTKPKRIFVVLCEQSYSLYCLLLSGSAQTGFDALS